MLHECSHQRRYAVRDLTIRQCDGTMRVALLAWLQEPASVEALTLTHPFTDPLAAPTEDGTPFLTALVGLVAVHSPPPPMLVVGGLSHHGLTHFTLSWYVGDDIPSLECLRPCTQLASVDVRGCYQLQSLAGLEHAHKRHLAVIRASYTRIADLRALGEGAAEVLEQEGPPVLHTLQLSACPMLATLDGLEHFPLLQDVDISETLVASLAPLQPAFASVGGRLRALNVTECSRLQSLDSLLPPSLLARASDGGSEGKGLPSPALERLYAGVTPIDSLGALRFCTRLTEVHVNHCSRLPTLRGLNADRNPSLRRVNLDGTPLPSAEIDAPLAMITNTM